MSEWDSEPRRSHPGLVSVMVSVAGGGGRGSVCVRARGALHLKSGVPGIGFPWSLSRHCRAATSAALTSATLAGSGKPKVTAQSQHSLSTVTAQPQHSYHSHRIVTSAGSAKPTNAQTEGSSRWRRYACRREQGPGHETGFRHNIGLQQTHKQRGGNPPKNTAPHDSATD